MLRTELITAINGVLDSDPVITAEEKKRILKACRPPKAGPPITAREAMKMLEISRPTLRSYVHQGLLHQINITARKVRFDREEVEQLANYGMNTKGLENE
jgi:hypothetical protein